MIECDCASCKAACTNKPGWFMPGEAEKLTDFLGVSFEEVFNTKLAVDWFEQDRRMDRDVFVLSPSVTNGSPGKEFDANPHGRCVFYIDGKCSIHAVKPFECSSLIHTESHDVIADRHLAVAQAWNNEDSQKQVENLLGREPKAYEYFSSIFDSLF